MVEAARGLRFALEAREHLLGFLAFELVAADRS